MCVIEKSYLKPTADCQTKATNKKNIGITGKTSTKGENGAYASGKVKSNNIKKFLIYLLHFSQKNFGLIVFYLFL